MTPDLIRTAVLADVAAKAGTYEAIGARYGLTKGMVSGIVQRARGTACRTRAYAYKSTTSRNGGQDWESRLFEPYAVYKARLAMERARV